ncbi:MAG: hypothetical protein GF320_21820 [Armatimonadia bacterium]|nr:hypothetical protein [Armatimonadia bacterium]
MPSFRHTALALGLLLVPTLLAAPSLAQDAPPEPMLLGRVMQVTSEGGELTEAPLPEAYVLLGRGILLDTGGDGRDAVVSSDDPARRPAVELSHTGDDGRFAVPLPPGQGSVDVLVWRPGYTPVLRQAVDPTEQPTFRLQPGTGALHVSLSLPDGRLVLPGLSRSQDLPFVDAGLGLLLPLPPGYTRQPGVGIFTVARFAKGAADVLILRAPSRLDQADLAELLRQQTERAAGAPRLVRSHDVLLDGRRATWREFADEDERAVIVYATRRDASVVILFAAPNDVFDEGLPEFEESLAAARFLGGPSTRPERGVRMRGRGLGVELVLPEPWLPGAENETHLSAHIPELDCHFHLRLYGGVEDDPRQVARDALAGLDTSAASEPQWQLVGGAPAYDVSIEGKDPSTGVTTFLRAVAIQADREILLATFTGPSHALADCEDDMAAVLASVRFTGEK